MEFKTLRGKLKEVFDAESLRADEVVVSHALKKYIIKALREDGIQYQDISDPFNDDEAIYRGMKIVFVKYPFADTDRIFFFKNSGREKRTVAEYRVDTIVDFTEWEREYMAIFTSNRDEMEFHEEQFNKIIN